VVACEAHRSGGAGARLLSFATSLTDGKKRLWNSPQHVLIARIQGGHGRRRVVPPIPDELADVSPVLLLDVRVVIPLVRAPARELDLLTLAVPVEMVVDELRPVVRIDPAQPEGQDLPDLLQGRLDVAFAAPQHGPGLDPGRMDVGGVERVGAHSPSARWPACATRSTSVKPGPVTSQ